MLSYGCFYVLVDVSDGYINVLRGSLGDGRNSSSLGMGIKLLMTQRGMLIETIYRCCRVSMH